MGVACIRLSAAYPLSRLSDQLRDVEKINCPNPSDSEYQIQAKKCELPLNLTRFTRRLTSSWDNYFFPGP